MKHLLLTLLILLLAGEAWAVTVYVDPSLAASCPNTFNQYYAPATGLCNGTDANNGRGYKTWAEVSWNAGYTYLQKDGTTAAGGPTFAADTITVSTINGGVAYIDAGGGTDGMTPNGRVGTTVSHFSISNYSRSCLRFPKDGTFSDITCGGASAATGYEIQGSTSLASGHVLTLGTTGHPITITQNKGPLFTATGTGTSSVVINNWTVTGPSPTLVASSYGFYFSGLGSVSFTNVNLTGVTTTAGNLVYATGVGTWTSANNNLNVVPATPSVGNGFLIYGNAVTTTVNSTDDNASYLSQGTGFTFQKATLNVLRPIASHNTTSTVPGVGVGCGIVVGDEVGAGKECTGTITNATTSYNDSYGFVPKLYSTSLTINGLTSNYNGVAAVAGAAGGPYHLQGLHIASPAVTGTNITTIGNYSEGIIVPDNLASFTGSHLTVQGNGTGEARGGINCAVEGTTCNLSFFLITGNAGYGLTYGGYTSGTTGATGTAYNGTIYGNTGSQVYVNSKRAVTLKNTIISGATIAVETTNGNLNLTLGNNAYYDSASTSAFVWKAGAAEAFAAWVANTTETGSAWGNPLFTNAARGDFTLLPTSPARGAGLSSVWAGTLNVYDGSGTVRITDGTTGAITVPGVDIGAYQSQPQMGIGFGM
jgi:hypothetical protein